MNAVLEQQIIERLHTLDEPKLAEVLDFVEFLVERRKTTADDLALDNSATAKQSQILFPPTELLEVAGLFKDRVTPKTDEEIEAALLPASFMRATS
jgi:hypothetical protein